MSFGYLLFLSACGSALGGASRYTLFHLIGCNSVLVNLVGSFLYGFLFSVAAKYQISDPTKLFLFVGILGGFTTFSTYVAELYSYYQAGQIYTLVTHLVVSNAGGPILFWVGMCICERILQQA